MEMIKFKALKYKAFHTYALAWIFSCLISPVILFGQTEPTALLLTWKNDPTTTMVIDWHASTEDQADSTIHFRKATDQNWQVAEARQVLFPSSKRTIYRKEMTGLSPDTRYAFRVGSYERTYYFETMPENISQTPFMFAVGGDTFDQGRRERKICMERVNNLVGQYKPKFVLWSGQLPDDIANNNLVWRWCEWFDAFKNGLIDEDGNVIPVVITSGNHITNEPAKSINEESKNIEGSHSSMASNKPTYPGIPGQTGYRVLDFGNFLSIISLDIDHFDSLGEIQTKWLRKTLHARKNRPHVFPAYHAQAFPVHYSSGNVYTDKVKSIWTPLFDRARIPLVFEFQDQAYKRTLPIRKNQINPIGTIYLGHGGWTLDSKQPEARDSSWYIDQVDGDRNIILISLYGTQRYIRTVNEFGQIVDEYPRLFEHPTFSHTISSILPQGGVTLSAELAKTYGKVFIEPDNTGFSKGGFAKWDNANEPAGVIWTVPAHNTNDFTILFRYSHPGPDSAQLQLLVNGEMIEEHFLFEAIGNESQWKRSSLINAVLQKGLNKIELRSLNGSVAPRIDRLEIFPAVF